MFKKIVSILLCLSVALVMPGCTKNETKKDTEPAKKIFTDDCGRSVEIKEKITGIVSSGSLSQIMLMSIAKDELSSLSSKINDTSEKYFQESLLSLPYTGKLYGASSINIEEIALVNPDIIIDIGEAKKDISEEMVLLEKQTGIPCIHINSTLIEIPAAYRKLGILLAREEQAEELAGFLEKIYDQCRNTINNIGNQKARVLYLLGDDGLSVAAKGSYHAEIIDMLTENCAVSGSKISNGTGSQVSIEQIAAWDPDYIIFDSAKMARNVQELDIWKDLRAVKNGNFFQIPTLPYNWLGNPPSSQQYLGLVFLTAKLYKDAYPYDAKAEIKEYFNLFYDYNLSEEELADITMGLLD